MPTLRKIKVLRDSINLISNDSIKRLGKVAGCPYLSTVACEEIKLISKEFLEKIARIMATLLESAGYNKKKVVSQENALESLRMAGYKIYPTGEEDKLKKCDVFHPTQVKQKRSRGELSIKEVHFYQKQSDCVYLSKHGVETLIREVMQDFKTDVLFSAQSLGLIQVALESYIINNIKNALLITISCGKKTVDAKEIRLVRQIQDPREK